MKFYQFQFSPNAEMEFSRLSHLLQKRVIEKLHFFEKAENPLRFAKKLHGPENKYRFRVGDYRLIVQPNDRKVLVILAVLKIGHRREIYE